HENRGPRDRFRRGAVPLRRRLSRIRHPGSGGHTDRNAECQDGPATPHQRGRWRRRDPELISRPADHLFLICAPSKVVTCAHIKPSFVTYASAPRYGSTRNGASPRHCTLIVPPTVKECSVSNFSPH